MQWIENLNNSVNSIVWGPLFTTLLVGTGIYLSFRIGFLQFTRIPLIWRETVGVLIGKRSDTTSAGSITAFQATASAMAATIGVGNIAGVSTAIALGGPGAVFWMWMVACVGMATKFAEASLGLKFREVDADGRISGGVFYYIEKGLGPKWRPLALFYAFFAVIAAFGIGNMVQANTLAHSLNITFQIPTWISGLVVALGVGIVTVGGVRRIGKTAARLVPSMAFAYIVCALVVIIMNIGSVPQALASIVHYAFSPAPAVGGFAGAAIAEAVRYGVARGIFSNEAGLGSASIIYAQSRNGAFRQGLWGIWEVFVDTIVICTLTALVILLTGVLETGANGAELASNAFSSALGSSGSIIIAIALTVFSYTTILTWGFYGEKSWEYLFGKVNRGLFFYRTVFLCFIPIGAIGALELIWNIADTLNGLMAIPNLIALIMLGGVVAKVSRQ